MADQILVRHELVGMEKLELQIRAAQEKLGSSANEALAHAAYYIARSLGAATKKSATKRPIVQNPDPRWERDKRMAQWGVMKFRGDRSSYFSPIYRTGEFGKVRFISKTTAEMLERDRITGEVHRVRISTGTNPELEIPGIAQSKKRIIGRSGLAKKSWTTMQTKVARGGNVSIAGTGNVGSVTWFSDKKTKSIALKNDLRYAMDAIIGGASEIDIVVTKASNAMAHAIQRQVDMNLADTFAKGVVAK